MSEEADWLRARLAECTARYHVVQAERDELARRLAADRCPTCAAREGRAAPSTSR